MTAPRPVACRWERARIRATYYLGARMDTGNAMNRAKWCEDWLVERGFIVGDKSDQLQWEGFPEQVVKRDGNYRIVLTLTPLAQ